jgi:hypothetical protein
MFSELTEYLDAEYVAHESQVFASIETAIEELKAGRMVVIVDDDDRENEAISRWRQR